MSWITTHIKFPWIDVLIYYHLSTIIAERVSNEHVKRYERMIEITAKKGANVWQKRKIVQGNASNAIYKLRMHSIRMIWIPSKCFVYYCAFLKLWHIMRNEWMAWIYFYHKNSIFMAPELRAASQCVRLYVIADAIFNLSFISISIEHEKSL